MRYYEPVQAVLIVKKEDGYHVLKWTQDPVVKIRIEHLQWCDEVSVELCGPAEASVVVETPSWFKEPKELPDG